MMNVPYVVLKYATLLLSFPINNVVEVVLTTLSAILKCTNNPSHLQGIGYSTVFVQLYHFFRPPHTQPAGPGKTTTFCGLFCIYILQ